MKWKNPSRCAAYACNPNTQVAEAKESWVQDQPGLQNKTPSRKSQIKNKIKVLQWSSLMDWSLQTDEPGHLKTNQ
jgi:hypothetical protein